MFRSKSSRETMRQNAKRTEYGFSVAEMKLVHGGLAPVGVMIAYKK